MQNNLGETDLNLSSDGSPGGRIKKEKNVVRDIEVAR